MAIIATNLALKFAKKLGKKPLDFANELKSPSFRRRWTTIEIAGPGFLNFFMKQESLGAVIATILAERARTMAKLPSKHQSVDVEYVSANPTGDLHLGHTRGAALGDAIANLYQKAGYDVTREYYVNNCGNQVEHLGHSLIVTLP
jgi:arginyl-tRNA synthetase